MNNTQPLYKEADNHLSDNVKGWWARKGRNKKNELANKYLGFNIILSDSKTLILKNWQINEIYRKVQASKPINNKCFEIDSPYYRHCHNQVRKAKGRPTKCESPECQKNSKKFQWALKKGREYSPNPDDYIQLCVQCHRIYDMNEETIKKNSDGHKGLGKVLTTDQVIQIKKLLLTGKTQREIAELFPVSEGTISSINNGYTWSHLQITK